MDQQVGSVYIQTQLLFRNVDSCFGAVDENGMSLRCHGIPLWKHFYHMLHSLDQWFINPTHYTDPPFHRDGLNAINEKDLSPALTRDRLEAYFGSVRKKVLQYIESLSDKDLWEKPEGSSFNRLELAMGQFRHLMYHVGFIQSLTYARSGVWPEFQGMDSLLSEQKDS